MDNKIEISWIIGLAFTLSLFSVNFTFFSYNLSKYKNLIDKISLYQWVRIVFLICIPVLLVGLSIFLYDVWVYNMAVWSLPIIILLGWWNSISISRKINPLLWIGKITDQKKLENYICSLSNLLIEEKKKSKEILSDLRDSAQIASSPFDFKSVVISVGKDDVWDNLASVTQLIISNDDYEIFKKIINEAHVVLEKLIKLFDENHKDDNIKHDFIECCKNRFSLFLNDTYINSKNKIYTDFINNFISEKLRKFDISKENLSIFYYCKIAAQLIKKSINNNDNDALFLISTLNIAAEIYGVNNKKDKFRDTYYCVVADIINLMKGIASQYIDKNNSHIVYKTMKMISYIGCNAVKRNDYYAIVASFETLAQLGRECRAANIKCFWHKCMIPIHIHAEEFMSFILSWLFEKSEDIENFECKNIAEAAYSRLRGFECEIIYDDKYKYYSQWINFKTNDLGEKIPYVESESGMYGYGAIIDYSDYTELQEYNLIGTKSIFKRFPVPICQNKKDRNENVIA